MTRSREAWRKRLYLYPSPEPLPHTRAFWQATSLVAVLTLLFSIYFIWYLTAKQDALLTNAEDLGIMDQAMWNTVHGHLFHQTICNILNDTNCVSPAGISRFALHFEPILFPVSLLYFIWPSPKTLQIVQTLVVASGAFPAFWLARLRLRLASPTNEWAGVAIALLYLLYPAQQNALLFDFHAVTFTAALLLFTLYFLYTRRTAWLMLFAVCSMACKEEIPLIIALLGLWSLLLQHRWRSGLALMLLAIAWVALSLLVMHHFSPVGNSLLASRYRYLGSNPWQVMQTISFHPLSLFKQHVWEHTHRTYLSMLLAPASYLPLLAPWVLLLVLPTLALNLFSTDPAMYSGLFQYNAEIVPILIFATIEAIVVLTWLAKTLALPLTLTRGGTTCSGAPCERQGAGRHQGRVWHQRRGLTLMILLTSVLCSTLHEDFAHSGMPFAQDFRWPTITMKSELAQQFIAMIPPTASVSAQTRLVPHLSQRLTVYLFPYEDDAAEYILLDVTGDKYPYASASAYYREVQKVLLSGHYSIVAGENGYLLLKRRSSTTYQNIGASAVFVAFPGSVRFITYERLCKGTI